MSTGNSRFEEIIIDLLNDHPDSKLPVRILEDVLRVQGKKEKRKLQQAVDRLVSQGAIKKQGKYLSRNSGGQSRQQGEMYTGELDVTRSGRGFVIVDGLEDDIKLSSKDLGLGLNGDTVKVKVTGSSKRSSRKQGKVVDVVERGRSTYVGVIKQVQGGSFLIESREESAHVDFYVLAENLNEAKHDDVVTFKMLNWSHPDSLPQAEVLDILGRDGSNEANILSILAGHNRNVSFPKEVIEFTEKMPKEITEHEARRRRDIRDSVVFTIDPADAKDFDDAISVEKLSNGNYMLGVHIADVTYYVTPDTVLDEEAYNRGTSVYLVDRVIPMLPEELSNGVCSLRPHEDKLTYSCFMEVNPKGKVVNYSIDETVIHSNRRYTYEEAQAIIDGEDDEYAEQVRLSAELARILLKKRQKEGAIDFDTPEPRFVLNEEGWPVDVVVKERIFSNRLIEECMLLANRTVAEHVDKLRDQSGKEKTKDLYPFFYRVHDKPDLEKLNNVAETVKPLGIDVSFDRKNVSSKLINSVLQQVKESPMELTINQLMLRSMAKAEYDCKNIGHFGLGFKHYSHFTSPIRRYPDVIVHRLLKLYDKDKPGYQFKQLKEFGSHCSMKEREAVDAERDSIKLKQVEFLSDRIGEEFDGIISGVTENGIYVTLNDIHCEGMIRVSDLTDDYYVFNQDRHALVGRKSKREYQLGKEIRAKVVNTDLDKRQIDLTVAKAKKRP